MRIKPSEWLSMDFDTHMGLIYAAADKSASLRRKVVGCYGEKVATQRLGT